MHHKRFRSFLQRLDGLTLPAQRLSVDGEEGETNFADLVVPCKYYATALMQGKRAGRGGRETYET